MRVAPDNFRQRVNDIDDVDCAISSFSTRNGRGQTSRTPLLGRQIAAPAPRAARITAFG
jgi:hypothetical protein